MQSSNSSLNLSFSTRVLLLLLFLGCFRPSSSAALRKHTNDRWRDPCAGETPAFEMFIMTTDEALEELSRSSTDLKRIVSSLKNDYIAARFRDESDAEEQSSGHNITGSPSWTASSDDMNETLLVCYENLARLAVLTRLTREAEQSAEAKENHHFADRFREIEYHHDSGLYIIMCRLYNIMDGLGIKHMSNETEAEVASISFDPAPTNAIRHVRDYIVLVVLENSADQLSSRFDRLANRVASPFVEPW